MEWGTRAWFLNKYKAQGVGEASAYYSHNSNGYQTYRHKRLARYLQEGANRRLSGKLLDIGCGTGELTGRIVREHEFDVAVGIDFVGPVVEEARRNFSFIEFREGTIPFLEFPEKSFDVVVASEVLYYLNEDDRLKSLEEIYRVLREGGLFLFSSVLGPEYFSLASARDFVQKRFMIEGTWTDYNNLYRALTYPLVMLNSLNYHLFRGGEPTNVRLQGFYRRYGVILRNTAFKQFLKTITKMSQLILRSESLPSLCGHLSRVVVPAQRATNVSILARKAIL